MRDPSSSPPGVNPAPPGAPQNQDALPPGRGPVFWTGTGMLAGLLLAALLFFLYGQRQAVPPSPTAAEALSSAELLSLQRARNKGMEEELLRLRAALQEDPCRVPETLGPSPDTAVPAPEYAKDKAPEAAPGVSSGPSKDANVSPEPLPAHPGTPPPAPAPAPATVSELMDKATVFVFSLMGGQVSMGSGFFVAPGLIATNRHVVQGEGAAVYVGNAALGGMHQARLVAFSSVAARDYALLRVPDELAAAAPVLRIADSISRTDKVSAWGFPAFITEIDPKLEALARGDVRAVPDVVYAEGVVSVVLDRKPPIILHTAPLSQGSSGGPLVNGQGLVVGINTFIKAADSSHAQANIALSARDLALFMQENGLTPGARAR